MNTATNTTDLLWKIWKSAVKETKKETCLDRHKFRPGDRVITRERVDHIPPGKKGTVLSADEFYVGVCFDEHVKGHDGCNSYMSVLDGHGWYIITPKVKYLGWRVNPATVPARR